MSETAPEARRVDEQVQTENASASRQINGNVVVNGGIERVHVNEEAHILACDYINYRLRKAGHIWSDCPPLPAEPSRRSLIMRTLGEEFEHRYGEVFNVMSSAFEVTPSTVYPTFMGVSEELFRGNENQMEIKWGRIVALFTMAGALAVQCVSSGMEDQVSNIAEWVSRYTETYLSNWIASHDGWDGFVQYFENTNNEERWSPLKKILTGVGIASICGGIALGAILAGRS